MKIWRTAAGYLAAQGLAVAVWWCALIFVPASRTYFLLDTHSGNSLLAFWLADVGLIVVGSGLASGLLWRNKVLAPLVVAFVCGAVSYATLYCLGLAYFNDKGWLGVALMLPAMLWSSVFAFAVSPLSQGMFRTSRQGSTGWLLAKTLLQIAVVWTLILFVLPYWILLLEDKVGVQRVAWTGQKLLAIALFIGISSIGLAGAYTMSKVGRGTPLPVDAPSRLVVAGVYRYVRNPMAISGIGQGLAVSLYHGSFFLWVYALIGAFAWQLIFRPLEEEDLLQRFGADYQAYMQAVRCWRPRLRPY